MKSQQHRWKTGLSQVVRHQGGASTVEWIGLLAIALVALGVSAFALTQNGNVVGGSFARQFECALRVIGIEGVSCEQLDEAEERGIDVPQQTIDPPPSLPADEGYECQQGESTIGDDGYLQQTTTCSRVSPENPKAVETCTATATGQDLFEGEAAQSEYSCETTQVVPEPLEDYECTETTSTTADGDQQFDQDCWRVSPDDPGSVEECHNSTVVNAQSLADDTSWNCETQRVAPEPLPAEEGWECNDSTDGNQLTQTCEKREENGDETTITTCTNTTAVQPGGESSGWDCESVVEREEEECKLEWKFWKTIENCTREYIFEPIAEHVIEPFLGALEDVWEGAKAFLTGELQALIGIIEGIIEFFKNPSLEALLKILDSACGSMALQLIPGGGDALGAMCDAKELIESSMDGNVVEAVIAALSLAIEALFAFVPGMGDFVGELMDQLTPTIRNLFRSTDEGVEAGQTAVRQGDEADDVADAADEAPDSDVCITYRGKVRGLAIPEACAPEVGEPTPKRQRTECTTECQNTVQQHEESIGQAKTLQEKAPQVKASRTKTKAVVMVDGQPKEIISGYADEFDPDELTQKVQDFANPEKPGGGFEPPMTFRRTGANDGGIQGRAQASHTEKKGYMAARESTPPGEPIVMGISKGMCDQCIGFMMRAAKKDGRDVIVSDPNVTRIFKPDGSVIMIQGDKTVNYPPPTELTKEAWDARSKQIMTAKDPDNPKQTLDGFEGVGPNNGPPAWP